MLASALLLVTAAAGTGLVSAAEDQTLTRLHSPCHRALVDEQEASRRLQRKTPRRPTRSRRWTKSRRASIGTSTPAVRSRTGRASKTTPAAKCIWSTRRFCCRCAAKRSRCSDGRARRRRSRWRSRCCGSAPRGRSCRGTSGRTAPRRSRTTTARSASPKRIRAIRARSRCKPPKTPATRCAARTPRASKPRTAAQRPGSRRTRTARSSRRCGSSTTRFCGRTRRSRTVI